MRQQKLGEKLRALILATPLIVAPGCGRGGPVLMPVGSTTSGSTGSSTTSTGTGTSGSTGSSGGLFIPTCGFMSNDRMSSGTGVFGLDGGPFSDCMAACGGVACLNPNFLACGCNTPYWESLDDCEFASLSDGGAGVSCTGTIGCAGCTGRRPAFLLPPAPGQASRSVGDYFAEACRLEAASIPAFDLLAGELVAHGAPARLARQARRSARDEVRHARATAALARRHGATPIRPAFGAHPSVRVLHDIATENAIEGCVRETYGALVALWQASHAQDPAVAATMAPIAADETRHAELAWEVAAWAEPRLSRTARRDVQVARARAFADLRDEVSHPVPPSLVRWAGLPAAESATALVTKLAEVIEM